MAHNNLGYVLYNQGNHDEAIPQYQESIRLDSKNAQAHFNLGIAFRDQSKQNEAISELKTAKSLFMQEGNTQAVAEINKLLH